MVQIALKLTLIQLIDKLRGVSQDLERRFTSSHKSSVASRAPVLRCAARHRWRNSATHVFWVSRAVPPRNPQYLCGSFLSAPKQDRSICLTENLTHEFFGGGHFRDPLDLFAGPVTETTDSAPAPLASGDRASSVTPGPRGWTHHL